MRKFRLPPLPEDLAADESPDLAAMPDNTVVWIGHACFALRIGGKLILTDPYLSLNAGPFVFGPRRFLPPAVPAGKLPQFDAIVISHNHYDHLDVAALRAYRWKDQTPVICPLGNGAILRRIGFTAVSELDWWEETHLDGVTIRALPAVHFSGRGLFDRNKALWASFALYTTDKRVWFGGDTASGEVFDEIGARAGPFDLALVGIGAYEPQVIMKPSHATPEEAIGIARQIGAHKAIGMHWGSIMLTPEDPFEASQRFRQAALEQQYGEDNAWILRNGEMRAF